MRAAQLTCQELVELVTNYLEGVLSAADRGRFEEHLEECEGCSIYLEQMRRTIRVAGSLTEQDIPQRALDRLLGAFRHWKGR